MAAAHPTSTSCLVETFADGYLAAAPRATTLMAGENHDADAQFPRLRRAEPRRLHALDAAALVGLAMRASVHRSTAQIAASAATASARSCHVGAIATAMSAAPTATRLLAVIAWRSGAGPEGVGRQALG